MDITDPEQETVIANDCQPENSTVGSHLFAGEQNGSESLASSKDEEVDDPLSECPDSPTPQSSPASQPQLSLARREIACDSSLDKRDQVSRISLIPHTQNCVSLPDMCHYFICCNFFFFYHFQATLNDLLCNDPK